MLYHNTSEIIGPICLFYYDTVQNLSKQTVPDMSSTIWGFFCVKWLWEHAGIPCNSLVERSPDTRLTASEILDIKIIIYYKKAQVFIQSKSKLQQLKVIPEQKICQFVGSFPGKDQVVKHC